MLRKISFILGCLVLLPLTVQGDEEERTVSAAKAATRRRAKPDIKFFCAIVWAHYAHLPLSTRSQ